MDGTCIVLLLLSLSMHFSLCLARGGSAYNGGDDESYRLNYEDALSKAILFFEAQRSGWLPQDQRAAWRGDSALSDGLDSKVDLVGGYYDAGDNVKYGLPMAFTITMLSWGALEYGHYMSQVGELEYVHKAIRWGTTYFIKANTSPTQLWVQVGDAIADHDCWEHPESMDTPRTTYQINASSPGTEIAAETAAAMASASIVFAKVDNGYSILLLERAIMLFQFADEYRGSYSGECPFYCSSSGYDDELLWAATWLYKATYDVQYLSYIKKHIGDSGNVVEFSWDNKFAGVQVLLSQLFFQGESSLQPLKPQVDFFFCSNLPNNSLSRIPHTPGGLLYVRDGANTQYSTGASFLAVVYADYIKQDTFTCGDKYYYAKDLLNFAKGQVDYILGRNPMNMSYMVGFGSSYPQQAHHRGASIVSIHVDSTLKVSCLEGFSRWLYRNASNPNVLVGAIVGGPSPNDSFFDYRSNSVQLEPTTYINAPFVGVLARLLYF